MPTLSVVYGSDRTNRAASQASSTCPPCQSPIESSWKARP